MSKQQDWWKESIVYQIYPKSFKDSNNDGIGDIRGIIQKLEYLKYLGINVIWLNPIFESPMVDNGYDISNYYKMNLDFGTKDELKLLVKEAHNKGIKIILDLPVNHTSNQHKWFIESAKNEDNKYSDYYIWKSPKKDGSEPNNWISSFGGSAWEYNSNRNKYYLHCFAKEQPDLNWENPNLRKDIYKMMRYWLDFGIDGFRLDVISLLSKCQDFPDSPPQNKDTKNYYIGVSNGPRIHEFIQEMNDLVFSKYDVMIVGETPNTTLEQAILYTSPKRKEMNMVFQFDHMHIDYGELGKFSNVRFKLSDLKKVMTKWQNGLEEGWNALYWSNHDQPRPVTRFGDDKLYRKESAKMLGTLLHMMKGTPFIFQGEELGMKNVPFLFLEYYQDIETRGEIEKLKSMGFDLSFIEKVCYLKSRDNARTPIPWTNKGAYNGFSNTQPWIRVSPDNVEINVENELRDKQSVFFYYRELIRIRKKYDVVINGKYRLVDADDSEVFAYIRETDKEELFVICSFSDSRINYVISKEVMKDNFELLLSNYARRNSQLKEHMILKPYESLIYYRKKK